MSKLIRSQQTATRGKQMATGWRWLSIGLLGLLLTGCIQQEVHITLNSDGSGTLVVRRTLSDMESGISMLGEEVPPVFDTLTVIRNFTEKTADTPSRTIQVSEYA